MKTLTLFVNEQCNRKCVYCDIPKLKDQKPFDKQLFKKFIPLINNSNFEKIVITGGEVGLLDKDRIDLIFQINKDIEINTNGVFIQKYFGQYRDQICKVVYHPVSEINQDILFDYTDTKIQYLVPIHKNNIKLLDKFLYDYSHIIFELSPYDSKYNDKFKLSTDDYKRVLSIINNHENITYSTIQTFSRLVKIRSLHYLRELCNCNLFMEIDFINGFINNCVCSYTRSTKFPLTEENFSNIDKLNFEKPDICDTCLSIVVWFDILIRNKIDEKVSNQKDGDFSN